MTHELKIQKQWADAKFLGECAALFRMSDPNRADRIEQIANSINV